MRSVHSELLIDGSTPTLQTYSRIFTHALAYNVHTHTHNSYYYNTLGNRALFGVVAAVAAAILLIYK